MHAQALYSSASIIPYHYDSTHAVPNVVLSMLAAIASFFH